jgi:hypothetical protein
MPRKLRVQYPSAIYHVMNRGDRREPRIPPNTCRKSPTARGFSRVSVKHRHPALDLGQSDQYGTLK